MKIKHKFLTVCHNLYKLFNPVSFKKEIVENQKDNKYFYLNIVNNLTHSGNKELFEKVYNKAIEQGLNLTVECENTNYNIFNKSLLLVVPIEQKNDLLDILTTCEN